MAILGYTTHASTNVDVASPIMCKFTPSEAGTITSMTAWFGIHTADDGLRFAVYSDNAGTPNAKQAESTETTITATGEFSASISYAFASGTPIWLAMWTSAANCLTAYDAGTTHQSSAHGAGYTYPNWPATWSEVFALDRVYSIWATYTPSAGALMGQILT